jgi:hypothetical protein
LGKGARRDVRPVGGPRYLDPDELGEDPENPRYIHTEWGVGYRFAPPP